MHTRSRLLQPALFVALLVTVMVAALGCRAQESDEATGAPTTTFNPAWDDAPPPERPFDPSRKRHPLASPGQPLIGALLAPLDGGRPAVHSVTEGGPAEAAGMRAWDVIVSVEGTPVASMEELEAALRRTTPGRAIKVRVERDGEPVELEITTVALEK
jgi:S1-C subfamily serine protease